MWVDPESNGGWGSYSIDSWIAQRAGAIPAGHDDHLGMRELGQGPIGGQAEHPVACALGAGLLGDELNLGAGQPREDLIGADRVECRDAFEDRDRDVHGLLATAGPQSEPAQHQQRLLAERPPRGQDSKLGRDVVQVEKAADTQ